jgi:hypothetical protein
MPVLSFREYLISQTLALQLLITWATNIFLDSESAEKGLVQCLLTGQVRVKI